ncbi:MULTISPECIES: LysR substrate-binding domain-containing protein [unclassified Bradyrhizobium]|uniref:LysR substrate-binding domain-containing protein n=1 Tax=unclassified Bradyrhizobium TaxID=2631580 RepID=UPI002916956E|nr:MULTISPECIES: LysR substrate-binding domain-containing protein [unclassified Bradyrhizobium]
MPTIVGTNVFSSDVDSSKRVELSAVNVVPYLKVLPHFVWIIGALADERIRWRMRTSGELPRVEDDAFQVIKAGSERKTIRSQLRAAWPALSSAVAQNAGFATNVRFSKAQWAYRFKCRTTPKDANDRFSKRHESVSCYARSQMIRRLPPFGPLVAFDAVARNRSFTRAADELGVTQSAISHQVRRLEEFFGMQLLIRRNPGVELSDDGARLEGELGPLLDEIAGLGPSLRYRSTRQMLRLGAGSSLAGWWLVRRLRAFRHSNSEIEIDFRLVESEAVGEPPLDVRILWTTLAESRATPLQEPLLRERIFPVCAPSLLPQGMPLSDPTALLDLPLIQKGHPPEGEWSWAYWFGKLGLKRTEPHGLLLGDMGLCLTAAVEGAGVAIGRSLLVADAITDGRLVPALANAPLVLSNKVHIARWSQDRIGDPHTKVLVNWLAQAAEDTDRAMSNDWHVL